MPYTELTMHLSGKVALITGGSRGIGRAISLRLARDGARVVVNYRAGAAEAAAVVAEIKARGGDAVALQADITDPQQVARMVSTESPIDVLVNNAGLLRRGDLADFDFAQMDLMRRTNVDGLVHCTRAVVDGMKQREFGRIINITSIAAHGTSFAGTTFYAATKSAVSTLTRRFALELGPFGITVNAVAPGFILTEMTDGMEDTTAPIAARAMVRRVGQPDDVANAVAFLASPESGFITAQILTVDGGRMDYITHG